MFSLVVLFVTPWLVHCMSISQTELPMPSTPPIPSTPPPPTTTPLPTTIPAMCTCSDGTQIPPGETVWITSCRGCYCDEYNLETQEIIADCFISPCVDSVQVPGQCCRSCPNGENCLAEFIDFNGTARSEIISVNDGVVDFGAAQCKCDYENYFGEPKASCEQVTTTPPPTTTPLPTTIPAMCTCSDGTQVQPGQSVWISPCRGCYCDENNLEAYEVIADCFMTPCVDSVRKPDQCCPECPNGHNCRAKFVDEYGVKRNEIISFSDGVVKFNSTECQCDYNNYHGEPKALCVFTMSIEPITVN